MVKEITILDFKEVETVPEVKSEAEKVVEEYFLINEKIKELTKKKNALNLQLKDNEIGNYKIGNFGISITEVNSKRFDSKSAKEFLLRSGEDISTYETESSYKKLNVVRYEE